MIILNGKGIIQKGKVIILNGKGGNTEGER